MRIKIDVGIILRQLTGGQQSIEVKGKTIAQCLEQLVSHYPGTKRYLFEADGKLAVTLLLNQVPVRETDLDKPVSEGDILTIVPIVGGG